MGSFGSGKQRLPAKKSRGNKLFIALSIWGPEEAMPWIYLLHLWLLVPASLASHLSREAGGKHTSVAREQSRAVGRLEQQRLFSSRLLFVNRRKIPDRMTGNEISSMSQRCRDIQYYLLDMDVIPIVSLNLTLVKGPFPAPAWNVQYIRERTSLRKEPTILSLGMLCR